MSKETQAFSKDIGQLAGDARALMAATADVAGEKVSDARKRLAAALERSEEIYGRIREKAAESARAVDQTVRENPYRTLAIAFGAGALFGYLAARRCSRDDN